MGMEGLRSRTKDDCHGANFMSAEMEKIELGEITDFELFKLNTEDFIEACCPDSSEEKKQQAIAALLKTFKYLFDKNGKRIALGDVKR